MDGDAQLLESLINRLGVGLALGVVVVALIVTLGWQFLKASVESRATAAIDRELDAHRTRLQLSADAVRLDFQRRIADFGLFNDQRHRSYRRMFRRALEAEGAFAGLVGGFIGTDYSRAEKAQVATLLGEKGSPGEVREGILRRWDEDRPQANRMLDAALKKSREVEAHLAFQRFKNELLLGDLYVSQDVREALAGLNLALAALSAHIIVPNDTGARPLELKSGSS